MTTTTIPVPRDWSPTPDPRTRCHYCGGMLLEHRLTRALWCDNCGSDVAPILSAREIQVLAGLDTDLSDEWFGRHDAESIALRAKLDRFGLKMCWPCQGTGSVKVERDTQSGEQCSRCKGWGYSR